MKRKKVRIAKAPEVNTAIFALFLRKREGAIPISSPDLSIQAEKYSDLHLGSASCVQRLAGLCCGVVLT